MEEILEIPVKSSTNLTEKEQSLLYLFGGILFVLLLLGALSSNVYYIKRNKEKRLKNNKLKAERIEKEKQEYEKKLMANPYGNILSEKYFEIHKEGLRKLRVSTYQGVTYHLGPKAGLYYRSSTGTRIYL